MSSARISTPPPLATCRPLPIHPSKILFFVWPSFYSRVCGTCPLEHACLPSRIMNILYLRWIPYAVPLHSSLTFRALAFPFFCLPPPAGMIHVRPLPKTRVPIVKFHQAELAISCDVCVNKRLGPRNTQLMSAYAEV